MELQQRFSLSANEYEEGDGDRDKDGEKREMQKNDAVKTEDLYQCLQFPPTAHQGTINSTTLVSERSERKYVFLLSAVNILISVIILVIVIVNYSHNRESQQRITTESQAIKGQKEMWLLHDNVFYLFWSDRSDCSAAESFCSKRDASLAILTERNKVWLMSKTNGQQFLVSRTSSYGSGDMDSPSVDDDHEDYECGIMTDNVNTDHGEGFVCERRMNP
ncbi:uncharacterized protein LOC127165009 [Labeo rohita]|uniref:uncharacterized protein LOC127165009 n=1 Tax=Labeo rohita TaxID=84645 RepID=UPI0021E1F6B0|nr:uncharacterized protein LOC127165009 [Labeo rohita]